ncbi:tetratricopeptide domain protein [Thiorhodococcus drewsii AZ1]|uniref:Tetratricopeptide domain protein n=1 Tax=Thiorhodococcus drewsii AZ1 TaxID=765913 RepID=G2E8J6_9GAMM|nr:tetratricopeptide repeat protein [Thiorhodococcus drewsii]EGV27574.1 tetratricopeptide domain protein [Thiorhodococcus drewsii AZ1]
MDGFSRVIRSAWNSLSRNKEWLFSGLGLSIVGAIGTYAWVFFHDPNQEPQSGDKDHQGATHITQSGFSAGGDMVAAGRDITGSVQIQKGYSPEDLHAIFQDQQALSARLGVTEGNIRTFFRILEQGEVPREQWPQRLLDIANRHKEALHRLAALRTQDPQSQVWLDQARAAIEAGDYAQAEHLLDQAEQSELSGLQDAERLLQEAKEAVAKRRGSAAALRAEKAELFAIQLRYLDAAATLASAVELVAETDPDQRLAYLDQQADMLQTEGDEHGNNAALKQAIVLYQGALLPARPRARVPLVWAATQNNLGTALARLGARESGTARLEQAVATYRAALEECTRERVPLAWAGTQNNLGLALAMLGARESGTARLEEAVAAYRAALEERTRERVPLGWAATQNNLGNALTRLGARESGTIRLEEAVAVYRAALEEVTRERVPLVWAQIQNNLGSALLRLGERASGTARLEEAVAAFRAALKEYTRERVPLDWARTQTNLGNALMGLGGRESGTARLNEAVAAFRAALEERTQARVPLAWAMTQNNLGNALLRLGERDPNAGTNYLQEARDSFQHSWTVYQDAGMSQYDNYFQQQLDNIETLILSQSDERAER